jgi:PAS domain S-box-containing protein
VTHPEYHEPESEKVRDVRGKNDNDLAASSLTAQAAARPWVVRYGVAVGLVGVMALVKVLLDPLSEQQFTPFLLFFGAVMASALFGGFGPGLLTTVLAAAVSVYLFFTPAGSLVPRDFGQIVRLLIFVSEGLAICWISVLMRSARYRSRQALQTLRESEERFRATFEQAAVGIAHVAPDGSWLRVNDKLCEIVGYPREELLALTFQDITHPEDLERDLHQVRSLLHGEIDTYAMEKRYVRKDGSVIWINLTGSLVRQASGEPAYFIVVVEDVQERRRSRETLEEQARLLNLTHDAIIVLGMDGTITFWSGGAEETYGWRREQVLGKNSHGVLKTRFPEPLEKIKAKLLRDGRWEGELLHERRDGVGVVAASRWSLQRDDEGNPVAILEINNDVTAQKKAEEQLAEIRTAERHRIARDLHDVVLQDLSSALQALRLADARATFSRAQPDLGRIIGALQRGADGLRSAVYDLRHERRLFTESLEALVELDGRAAPEPRIEVSVESDFPKDLPEPAGTQLLRVLQEALANARRHSGARRVRVSLRTEDDAVCAEVSDDGSGFDPDAASTGVGLSAMRERVEALGGKITIRSRPGEGTRVIVRVPSEGGTPSPRHL